VPTASRFFYDAAVSFHSCLPNLVLMNFVFSARSIGLSEKQWEPSDVPSEGKSRIAGSPAKSNQGFTNDPAPAKDRSGR
jgi:hypothetical protein